VKPNMTIKIAILTFVLTCASATFAQSSACAKTDYDCRIKELRQQIAANPKDSELYYNLALALQNKEPRLPMHLLPILFVRLAGP